MNNRISKENVELACGLDCKNERSEERRFYSSFSSLLIYWNCMLEDE